MIPIENDLSLSSFRCSFQHAFARFTGETLYQFYKIRLDVIQELFFISSIKQIIYFVSFSVRRITFKPSNLCSTPQSLFVCFTVYP